MPVRIESQSAVRILTLERPARRNAFNADLTLALDAALNQIADDPQARAIVLTGGSDHFSAGTDLREWAGEPTERGGPYGIAAREFTVPLIAAVEGVAAGGGFEIALAATMIVAARTASFSLPEVGLGLIAECGGLFRGPRALPLNVAHELLLTGEPLSAQRGYDLGLVNRLTEPGQALPEAVAIAHRIARQAPVAVRETLLALQRADAEQNALRWAETAMARERARASADAAEGVSAFLEKRPPRWTGR